MISESGLDFNSVILPDKFLLETAMRASALRGDKVFAGLGSAEAPLAPDSGCLD